MRLAAALPLDMQRNQSGAGYMDADRKRGTLARIPDSPTAQVGLCCTVIQRTAFYLRAVFFPLTFRLFFRRFFFPRIPPHLFRLLLSIFLPFHI